MRNPVLCCLFWSDWSHGGLWPKGDVLHVCDLPVVKIVLLIIFTESDYMYFIFCYKIILITTAWGWLCFLQYPTQLSLTWSGGGGVNLPNNSVSLYLQNWVDLNYYIRFAVLWLASVLNSCLENIGVLIFLFWGLRMGPQSFQNCTHLVLLLAP